MYYIKDLKIIIYKFQLQFPLKLRFLVGHKKKELFAWYHAWDYSFNYQNSKYVAGTHFWVKRFWT